LRQIDVVRGQVGIRGIRAAVPLRRSRLDARPRRSIRRSTVAAVGLFSREADAVERSLWYRYFFYSWLFRDVSRGSCWERSAAWRYNQSQAHWLLRYMRRWTVIGLTLFMVAAFVEQVLECPVLSACFYLPSALSMPYNAVTAVCWTFLRLGNAVRP
jgi:hypothetical protein